MVSDCNSKIVFMYLEFVFGYTRSRYARYEVGESQGAPRLVSEWQRNYHISALKKPVLG